MERGGEGGEKTRKRETQKRRRGRRATGTRGQDLERGGEPRRVRRNRRGGRRKEGAGQGEEEERDGPTDGGKRGEREGDGDRERERERAQPLGRPRGSRGRRVVPHLASAAAVPQAHLGNLRGALGAGPLPATALSGQPRAPRAKSGLSCQHRGARDSCHPTLHLPRDCVPPSRNEAGRTGPRGSAWCAPNGRPRTPGSPSPPGALGTRLAGRPGARDSLSQALLPGEVAASKVRASEGAGRMLRGEGQTGSTEWVRRPGRGAESRRGGEERGGRPDPRPSPGPTRCCGSSLGPY